MSLGHLPLSALARCPHGDASCPCPDGDPCHYEGPEPMACPNPPRHEQRFSEVRIMHLGQEGEPLEEGEALVADVVMTTTYPTEPHCHVAGCRWRLAEFGIRAGEWVALAPCGLRRIAPQSPANEAYELGCGEIRRIVEMPRPRG